MEEVPQESTRLCSEMRYSEILCEFGIVFSEWLFQIQLDRQAQVTVANKTGCTRHVDSGSRLAYAVEVQVVEGCDGCEVLGSGFDRTATGPPPDLKQCIVWWVDTTDDRRCKLLEVVDISTSLGPEQVECLRDFLAEHHQAFCIESGQCSEMKLVQVEIDIEGEFPPQQPVCHMRFAVRQKVAKQLKDMQQSSVIQPSCSPWASPVVMVQKKDRGLRLTAGPSMLSPSQTCTHYSELMIC